MNFRALFNFKKWTIRMYRCAMKNRHLRFIQVGARKSSHMCTRRSTNRRPTDSGLQIFVWKQKRFLHGLSAYQCVLSHVLSRFQRDLKCFHVLYFCHFCDCQKKIEKKLKKWTSYLCVAPVCSVLAWLNWCVLAFRNSLNWLTRQATSWYRSTNTCPSWGKHPPCLTGKD